MLLCLSLPPKSNILKQGEEPTLRKESHNSKKNFFPTWVEEKKTFSGFISTSLDVNLSLGDLSTSPDYKTFLLKWSIPRSTKMVRLAPSNTHTLA